MRSSRTLKYILLFLLTFSIIYFSGNSLVVAMDVNGEDRSSEGLLMSEFSDQVEKYMEEHEIFAGESVDDLDDADKSDMSETETDVTIPAKGKLRFWLDSAYPLWYEENGIYKLLLDKLERATSLDVEYVVAEDAETAINLLEKGEIELVMGIGADIADGRAVKYIEDVYKDSLAAIIMPDSVMVSPSDIGNYYWGVEEDYKSAFTGTEYEKHIIGAMNEQELFDSLENHNIYAAFIRASRLDYYLLEGELLDYKIYDGERFALDTGIAVNIEDENVNKSVCDIIEVFREVYSECGGLTGPDYSNLLIEAQNDKKSVHTLVLVLGSIIIVLGICLVTVLFRAVSSIKKYKDNVDALTSENDDFELLNINMKKKTISAQYGFEMLEIAESLSKDILNGKKNSMTLVELSELTGFNFVSHYEEIKQECNGEYHKRFIMYRNGRKRFISEEGKVRGNKIIAVIRDVSLKAE